ncbi:MAG: TIGR00730 family Rossman fold protein [Kineosporiaceae bacterium]
MAAVCVFCSSSADIAPSHLALARQVGELIGRRGHRLVSGGGRVSMMGEVARGARASGAHTLGVIPRALVAWEVADTEADELVVTDDMRERKGRMDAAADAFLALPGGLGTLEELLEVWVARTLGMHDKPIVVLDPEGVYRGLAALVDDLVGAGFVRRPAAAVLDWATDAEQAFDLLQARLDAAGAPPGAPVEPPVEPRAQPGGRVPVAIETALEADV